MRKITQKLTIIFLLLLAGLGYSQKVAVIGINHVGTDGFSFVVTNDLTNGEVIYFTENEYNPATNAFGDVVEAVVAFTAGSAITKGNVVFVNESSTNTFTVSCTSGGCGTATLVAGSGPFALATDGEALYAYSDSNNVATDGITTIHSVMFSGTTEGPGIINGGPIPAGIDPSGDFPLAIIVDGFPVAQPDRVEFIPTTPARTNVSRVILENPSNYVHAQTNAALSTLFFTNLNLVSANPTLTVTASPSSVLENSGTGMVYTFTLSVNAPSNMTVNFTVGGSAVFTTDYTQTGAVTFNATSGTITILSGSNTATMTLTPTGETSLEPHENIVITIGSGSGYDAGSPGAATTTITNDDTTDNDPMVALIGISHTDPDGFSFVATKDIPAGTVVYFTDNSFNNNTLTFGSGEAVLSWTSPGSTLARGSVVVVTETGVDTFTVTCSSGCGTVALLSGNFATATTGETLYAYSDTDANPSNGVTDVYSVLFTGTSVVTGGTIPTIEDPSTVYLSALVVDGFPSTPAPTRTEYNSAQRGVLVTEVTFEDISNWIFGQSPPALSTVPFANINVNDALPPTAVCQNISVTPTPGTGSVTITASQIDNGSTDNVGIASITVSPDTFTCANIGTPVTVTLTVTDTSGNAATCTATVTVLPNTVPTFTQIGPFCSGDTFSLPTTSNNGIAGTWAPAIDNTATTTYTFTPNLSLCGTPVTMTVVVNPVLVPTFIQVAPICSGGSLSALPTTSDNGVVGTWSPAIDNTATTTYTFTPSSGTCVTTATMTIVVNPLPTTPVVTSNSPVCEGDTVNLTVTNPLTGYTMNTNSGVAFIDIDATGTQITGLADDSEHNITIPAFTFNGITYTNARLGMNGVVVFGSTAGEITFTNSALPTSSVGAGTIFIAPFWEDLDIQTVAKVATQTVGNKYIIQYTTAAHDQFTTGSVTFQAQLDLVTGEITYVYQDVVFGNATYDLGASTTVGIQFSASSAIQYSFNTASLVNGQSITFSPVYTYAWTGPNGFTSNMQNPTIPNATAAATGGYNVVVTNTGSNCSSAVGTTNVVVNPTVTPVFTQEGPICTGDALSLPATSTNGVTGTWAPAIDNTTTTTYTFTPNVGQCAVTTTMTVVVNPLTSNTTTIATCDTYTWAVNGANYTASGMYTSVTGCNTEILDLTITPSTSNTTIASACDTYTWAVNGTTYTASGVYNVVTGCHTESLDLTIDQLNVTINPYTTVCLGQTLTLSANSVASGTNYVPFTGAFNVANWSFANAPSGVNGSVNTGGAPNSIAIVSGNSSVAGASNFSIVVPQNITTISFDWSYSTGDGANWDRPQVINNGVPTLMSGYSTGGGNNQSGTMTVTVVPGQTFALSMITIDGAFGAATVIITNFTASGNTPISYVWTASNGGTILGASNDDTVQVTTAGTYTVTTINGSCTDTDFVNVTFNNPAGDPTVFGNNVWNVYAWNSGGTEDTGSSWNTNYAGYYTIPSLSFSTLDQWPDGGSPSQAAGYVGCTVSPDNHSWSAKRRGFPAAVYSIDIPTHDDEAELWINGVLVWEHVGCCDAHSAVWQGNLGAFDTVEYRVTEGGGGSNGIITFNTLPFGPANLTATYCGATINNMAVTLVSNYVINAQAYRFRVRNGVTGAIVAIVDRPVNSFALSNIPGITLATTYSIDVTIRVNNVWQPFYGAPCTVTTPTPLATIGAQCGTTLTSMGQWIYATYQPSVSAYRFRITNNSTSAVEIYNPVSGLNKFNFNQLPAAFRTAGTVYSVEVALRNTDGTYLPYGAACNVTTPGAPLPTKTIVGVPSEFIVITYPNPFAENFMFDVKTNSEAAFQIRVYDMLGKQVEYRNVEMVDMASVQIGDIYPSGVYNVIVSQGESTQTLRVIKR